METAAPYSLSRASCRLRRKLEARAAFLAAADAGAAPYSVPAPRASETLATLAYQGLAAADLREERYRARLERELEVIAGLDGALPFLFAFDVGRYARQLGIPLGPGRGTSPGSLVCYALGITDVDPLTYGLSFERFLNPRGNRCPELTIEVCARRRDELLAQLLCNRYAPGQVAVAAAPADRAHSLLCQAGEDMSELWPLRERLLLLHSGRRLEEVLTSDAAFRALASEKRFAPTVARALERERSLGIFDDPWLGCTLVFGARPLPTIEREPGGWPALAVDGDQAKMLGWFTLLCAPVAALTALGPLRGAAPAEPDDETLRLFAAGSVDEVSPYADGLTPIEDSPAVRLLRQLQPRHFEDLAAVMALCRPGVQEIASQYVDRRHGREQVTYRHPALAPVLAATEGLPLYQEQIMGMAETVAGVDPAEADLLRRALVKRRPDELARWEATFLDRVGARGFDAALAKAIFEDMRAFACYTVSRSHAVAQARLGLEVAWMRAHA